MSGSRSGLIRARNAAGDFVILEVDDDGNLKFVTEAITIDNVNVLAPLGITAGDSDIVPLGATTDDDSDDTLLGRVSKVVVRLGEVDDAAWVSGDGPVIGLLKAIQAELVTANGLRDDIKTNTTPT